MGIIKEEIAASVTLPSADTITLKSTRSKDFLHEVELEDILNRIDDLDIGTELHYVSTGKWCLHHLIQALCLKIGKGARIRITSWMITEEPARQLVSMVQNGLISKLTLILDERIMDRRPQCGWRATTQAAKSWCAFVAPTTAGGVTCSPALATQWRHAIRSPSLRWAKTRCASCVSARTLLVF